VVKRDVTFESSALTVISTYEAAALISGRLPTITSLVRRLPWAARVGIEVFVSVWLAVHFDVLNPANKLKVRR
jgi:hypothetical protein